MKKQRGYITFFSVLTLAVMALAAVMALYSPLQKHRQNEIWKYQKIIARTAAESGIQKTLALLHAKKDFGKEFSESCGEGEFKVKITKKNLDNWQIEALGYIKNTQNIYAHIEVVVNKKGNELIVINRLERYSGKIKK